MVNLAAIESILNSKRRVDGLTHNFYRYPARFNPEFVREIIKEFTNPGDCVMDPFMGGGTTIVEALAAGRQVVGIDINELAFFVTTVKSSFLSSRDINELSAWVRQTNFLESGNGQYVMAGERMKNVPQTLQPIFQNMMAKTERLRFPRQRQLAKCAILKVGQWALDCRSVIPEGTELPGKLKAVVDEMIIGLGELWDNAANNGFPKRKLTKQRDLFLGSADDEMIIQRISHDRHQIKLLLTSPPYPGVHVLYHRWQINGRRETPAPYFIADLRDGHGPAHYTMGGRSKLGVENYFNRVERCFGNLRNLLTKDARVVQLIAFSHCEGQLPLYLKAMSLAGYEIEQTLNNMSSGFSYREVPNRKWYTNLQTKQDASHELLIIHKVS